ncbi:MAG: NADH-quinone oxidoreductase subunit J [Kofleriaceae bacterium]|nr:NADH-quinone oxidoreductase subunit J [Myxococcales bacterium]MCB9572117.1 NADH-quinone oxidoreductase subunit J [Kofleriaceae bacterium]
MTTRSFGRSPVARALATALAALVALVVALGFTVGTVAAQPAGPPAGRPAQPGAKPAPGARIQVGNGAPQNAKLQVIDSGDHAAPGAPGVVTALPGGAKKASRDTVTGRGGAMAVLFWMFALGLIGGALFVITRKNMIAAVMGMVGTFFAVAGLYMMLYASFLAVIQMLVYAGAIMVLFVFVIMILNKPEDEPWGMVGLPGKALAGVGMLYLLVRLGQLLWSVTPPPAALLAPPPLVIPATVAGGAPTTYDWGSTSSVGWSLFNDYLFPFEAVSILLLVAVVGAIAVARPFQDDEPADGADPAPAGQEATS